MEVSYLAEKTLRNLLQISPRRTEHDFRMECRHLAKELIEGSTGVKVRGELEREAFQGSVQSEELRRLADLVCQLNLAGVRDAARILYAVSAQLFEDGQKNCGRVFVFLALVIIVVQQVAPERPSQDEVSVLSDCVTDCLTQLRQACAHIHCQPKKYDYMTAITTGVFFMAGALIGVILLRKWFAR
ncbi:uncharacterized protein LOC144691124 [Cetorhinus maximus]